MAEENEAVNEAGETARDVTKADEQEQKEPKMLETNYTDCFIHWVLLAVFSAIALGSIVNEYSYGNRPAMANWAIACATITMSLSACVAVGYKAIPEKIVGNNVEVGCAFVSLVCWVVGLALNFQSGVFRDLIGLNFAVMGVNANIYYFTWAAFFQSLILVGHSIHHTFDVYKAFMNRLNKWLALTAFTLVVMVSSITNFQDLKPLCDNERIACTRTKLSMLVGLVTAVLSLVVLLWKSTKFMEDWQLWIESCLSFFITAIYAVTVGFITGAGSPGSIIGNLYYFTWLSFLTTIVVSVECFGDIKFTSDESSEAAEKEEGSVEDSPTIGEDHPAEEQAVENASENVAENV